MLGDRVSPVSGGDTVKVIEGRVEPNDVLELLDEPRNNVSKGIGWGLEVRVLVAARAIGMDNDDPSISH